MDRTAPAGDFRSNLHRGGTATTVDPDQQVKKLAVDSAAILGLRCAGVDVLQGPDGPLVLEVNGSPGLAGIEATTGVEVARCWIDVLEETVREGQHCEQG